MKEAIESITWELCKGDLPLSCRQVLNEAKRALEAAEAREATLAQECKDLRARVAQFYSGPDGPLRG